MLRSPARVGACPSPLPMPMSTSRPLPVTLTGDSGPPARADDPSGAPAPSSAPSSAADSPGDAAPPSGPCRFDEAVRLLGLPRSTAAARRRALELVVDRATGTWSHVPDDSRDDEAWRQAQHLIVPEWGGTKPPGADWTFDRAACWHYARAPYERTLVALSRSPGATPT